MSGEALVLTDYSAIPDEELKFCEALQKEIKEGKHTIIIPRELSGKKDDEKFPSAFTTYGGAFRTGKYAGILTYKGRIIRIHSRFDGDGGSNRFLNYCLSRIMNIPVKAFPDMNIAGGVGDFEPLLAYIFLRQLRDAFKLGIFRQYRSFEYNDSRIKGRIDVARHIRLNPMESGRVAYSTRKYTADNPINRLILAAYDALLTRPGLREFVIQLTGHNAELKNPIDVLIREVGPQQMNHVQKNAMLQKVARPITHPLHQRYESVRRTAMLILRHQGVQLFEEASETVGGILLPMDRLWELFLEQSVFPEAAAQVEEPTMLDEQGKSHSTFIADFAFGLKKENGRYKSKMVLDAKYRPAWSRAAATGKWGIDVRDNVFQVVSYLHVFGAPKAGVIFPVSPANAKRVEKPERFQLYKGLEEYFYTIPFHVPDSAGFGDMGSYSAEMESRCRLCAEQFKAILS